MGGEPWFHVAPDQADIPAALEALQRRSAVGALLRWLLVRLIPRRSST